MKFRFITVVWGSTYTDLLLNVAIPTQLSPGNLPSLPDNAESMYSIYTTSEDATIIKDSSVFQALSKLIPSEIVLIDDIDLSRNRYWIVSECEKRAMASAGDEDCGFVFPYPDCVWPDGAFKNMSRIASTGKRAVMCAGITAVTATCVPALLNEFRSENDLAISISPRELVALSMEHLDPVVSVQFWDSEIFSKTPAQLWWNVPDEGVLSRWFCPSPLMVRPQKIVKSFSGALDGGNFLIRACRNFDDLYVSEDSDELFHVSLRTPNETFLPQRSSSIFVARWAAPVTNRYQRKFLNHKIRIHFTDMSSQWEPIEMTSDRVVKSIQLILKFRAVFWLIDWKASLGRLRWALRHSRPGIKGVSLLRQVQGRFQGGRRGTSSR